jgi:single-stranded DNA-binding protein
MSVGEQLAVRVRRAAMFEQTLQDAPDKLEGAQAYATAGDTIARCVMGLSADPEQPLAAQARFRVYRLDPSCGRMSVARSGADDWPGYDPGDEHAAGLHLLALAKAHALMDAARRRQPGEGPARIDASGVCGRDGELHVASPLTGGRPIPTWRQAVASWTQDLAGRDPNRLRDILFDTTLHDLGSRRPAATSLVSRGQGPDLYVLAFDEDGSCRLGHYFFDQDAALLLGPDTSASQARSQIVPLCDIRQTRVPHGADRLQAADRMIDAYISQQGGTRLGIDLLAGPAPAARPTQHAAQCADQVRAPNIADAVATWIIDRDDAIGMPADASRILARAMPRQSGAAPSASPDTGSAINHQQRRSDTMMTQQVMRGNLASDPKYWPATTTEDGRSRQAYGEATIYRNRRIQLKDGTYADSPKGPEKVAVKFWGRDADLMHQAGFKSGDPVVAAGNMGDSDAYADREGNPVARAVINGDSISMDSMRIAASQKAADARAATATATVQQTYSDGFAAPMPAQTAGRTM